MGGQKKKRRRRRRGYPGEKIQVSDDVLSLWGGRSKSTFLYEFQEKYLLVFPPNNRPGLLGGKDEKIFLGSVFPSSLTSLPHRMPHVSTSRLVLASASFRKLRHSSAGTANWRRASTIASAKRATQTYEVRGSELRSGVKKPWKLRIK